MYYSKLLSGVSIAAALLATAPVYAAESDFPFPDQPFSDVPESHVSYEAIEYLRTNKILKGYPGGTFKADRRINRAEFVQLATNPFFLSGERNNECVRTLMQGSGATIVYSDIDTSLWYAHPVCIASDRGLVKGYPDGTFQPGQPITFVEAAKILSRIFVLDTREASGEMWYVPYVEILGEKQAIPVSVASLNHVMTRGEMAEMLYRLKTHIEDRPSLTYADLEGKFRSDTGL